MPSSRGSDESSRGDKVTLPHIRDILGEELTSNSKSSSSPRAAKSSFALAPLRSALGEGSNQHVSALKRPSFNQELGYAHRSPDQGRGWGDLSSAGSNTESYPQMKYTPTSHPPIAALNRSSSAGTPPYHPSFRPLDSTSLRRSSSTTPMSPRSHLNTEIYHGKSNSLSGGYPSSQGNHPSSSLRREYEARQPDILPDVDWESHRRRDSIDSSWSSHSSSSGASSHVHSLPPANALQFQPLPHSHFPPHVRPSNSATPGHYPVQTAPSDYQSPFGVLITDMDAVPPADPQRMAILRSLRASSSQGMFPASFDDPRNMLPAARYECPYCSKRFNRPSSLKIHINSHTGDKPFQCAHPGCGRRFSVQSNMRRHARVHQQGSRKASESSGEDYGEENASHTRMSPSMSPPIRPTLAPINVERKKSVSDTDDSSSSNARTAHPSRDAQGGYHSRSTPTQSGRSVSRDGNSNNFTAAHYSRSRK